MRFITKRNGAILSAFLAAVLGSQMVLYLLGNWFWDGSSATAAADSEAGEDMRIANDLSNMTGVSADEILRIKSAGLTWNEVITQLQDQDADAVQAGKNARDSLLLSSGLSEQAVAQLVAEGYGEEAIADAKLLAERVVFQLSELMQDAGHAPVAPSVETSTEDEEKQDRYRGIQEQFRMEEAVRLMLAWESDFGSYRQVLNEYLFMLQAGLEVSAYQHDREGYLEAKDKILRERVGEDWITIELMERDMLEAVQKRNELPEPEESEQQLQSPEWIANPEDDHLPEPPIPDVMDVKPSNPTDAIYEEIRRIDPKEALE